jgi:hypothetical protein
LLPAVFLPALLLPAVLIGCGSSEPPVYEVAISQADGVAIGGYDTVAYHTDGQAVVGTAADTATWNDATWQFSTPENQATFESSPETYAPAFGGHCSFANSLGKVERGDPEVFEIADGTLYLNSNPVAGMLFSAP